jgi:uncharacterized protein (TIGR00369 family)
MTTDFASIELTKIRAQAHSKCVVCSPLNKRGFGLEFMISKHGSVQTTFSCHNAFEGYANVLHGGVISCLLDGAMTNCMFAHGYVAVTAELDVRFQHPIVTGKLATVRPWIDRSRSRLHVVKAEFIQNGQVKATAVGKFMKQPPPTRSNEEPKRER